MTEVALPTSTAGPPEVLPTSRDERSGPLPGESLTRQVARSVLRRTTARLGIVWIGVLLMCAVFAPFLCNTHPLLMKADGQWSSPLLHNLTPVDVILQVAFWAAIVLLCLRRVSGRSRLLIWGACMLLAIILCPLLIHPPQLVVYETYRNERRTGTIEQALYVPVHYSPDDHQRDKQDARLQAPSREHWAGTTSDSADLLSNLVHAARIALSIGFISTGIAVVIGIIVGGLMGYYGGLIDLVGMRLVEIFDAIPTLLLLLIFVAVFTPNLYIMMAIIGLTTWVGYAYFIRAEFLSLRDRDFVQAARAAGLPVWRILFRHMLPNGVTPLIVSASFGVASAILYESTLSFLGIGLVSEASWGNLLEQALGEGGTFYWWIALYPGLAIFLTVFAYNLIGESLRDALDPRLHGIK
jgi:peptide/nickel transport system permease protein